MKNVVISFDRPLYNIDAELDCKETLRRVMLEFSDVLTKDEQKRVSDWFYARYQTKGE